MQIRKGFSLVEFILYFGILAIVMTAVTAFALEMSISRAKTRAVAEVEQNVRLAVQRVLRSVRQSSGFNAGPSVFNNDNGVLSLIQAATATDPTVFDLSSGAVRIKEGAGAATALTTPDVVISKLRFSRDNLPGGTKAITVFIQAAYNNNAGGRVFFYNAAASSTAVIRKQ